jgi:excisionase family DNA binding protein
MVEARIPAPGGHSALPGPDQVSHTPLMALHPEPSLSLSEAGARLGRSATEVLELIEDGELGFAPTRDIRSIRVPESAIGEFLEHHPTEPVRRA